MTMRRYEFFEHTADVKFRAYGKDTDERFGNAALAMTSILTDVEKVGKRITKSVSAGGVDLKALLYNFLEELLFLVDTEGFLTGEVQSLKITRKNDRYMLSALLLGDFAKNYETHGDIKAVTYAEMEITDNHIQVVLDI